jgi:hypothetical protein
MIQSEEAPPAIDGEPGLPRPKRAIEFPEIDEPSGPRTQDLDPIKDLEAGTTIGKWNLGLDLGGALNMNRRPSQLFFEIEGGYRLWEKIDINALLSYRLKTDKVLGLLVMPYYNWRLTKPLKTYRVDLRAGVGTGWLFRSFRGNTFQVGHLPIRTSVAGIFYPSSRWALVLSLDYEVWLFRVDSDGASKNEFSNSNGVPMQFIPTAGVRFEF